MTDSPARAPHEMPRWAWGLRGTYCPKLREIEHLTVTDLQAAVAQLPCEIRARLRRGPMIDRFSCRVCQAFGDTLVDELAATQDAADPRYIVFAYHEIPKCWMLHRAEEQGGPAANAIYERCIETYRAAGWKHVAAPADA
jgi:hypothetical protein